MGYGVSAEILGGPETVFVIHVGESGQRATLQIGRRTADALAPSPAYAAAESRIDAPGVLPARTGLAVDSLRPADGVNDGYVIAAGDRTFEAAQVVIATGYFRQPRVPDFAADLDPGIRQFHSSDYREPSQLADGPVLVVGVSHSGADLAFEAAQSHRTILSGKGHGQLPFSVDSRTGRIAWPIMKFVTHSNGQRTAAWPRTVTPRPRHFSCDIVASAISGRRAWHSMRASPSFASRSA